MILEGDAGGISVRWALVPGVHVIGRDPKNALVLNDATVSHRHAEIEVQGEVATIRDLGSRNGTWVNESRLTDPAVLEEGDRIRFGKVALVFRRAAPSAEPGARGGPADLLRSFGRHRGQAKEEAARGFRVRDAGPTENLLSDEEGLSTFYRLDAATASEPGGTWREPKLLRTVADAGRLLMGHQPLPDLFETVLDLIGRVVDARRILILLSEAEGSPPVVRAARPPVPPGERILLSRALLDTALQGRESLLIVDARTDARFGSRESIIAQDVRAALVAPLVDAENVIGLIYADSADPRVVYDQDQLRVLTLLAGLVAVKITTTRLLEAQQEMERLEQEMETASRIQQGLLPSTLPVEPGYELHAFQTPCRMVGGDLYDALRLEDGRLLLLVGDVCGKGMGAALLMANILAGLRLLSEDGLPLVPLAERMNRQMLRATDSVRFATLFLARLDPSNHRLEYVNAGHVLPLLCLPGGEVRPLASTGPPIGLLEGIPFEADAIDLPPGALLCVVSDGIPEAQRGEECFGDERLERAVTERLGLPLCEIAAGVRNDLAAFLQGEPPGDDITLMLLRRTEQPVPGSGSAVQ